MCKIEHWLRSKPLRFGNSRDGRCSGSSRGVKIVDGLMDEATRSASVKSSVKSACAATNWRQSMEKVLASGQMNRRRSIHGGQ